MPWTRFIFWIYLLVLVWAAATVTNPADPDLWHRLAVGEYLWQTGHFPPGDAFSYLFDYKQVADHEWGSALIFYALWQWGGGAAIVAAKLVTLAVTLALVVWAGSRDRTPTLALTAFYALVLLALLPSFDSTLRCMVFTHILLALWVFWFQCERHGRPIPTFLYIVTMIVWANLHGGFAIGLAWLLAVTVIELVYRGSWKKWALRLALCSLATLINPFGAQLWIATGRALTTTRRGFGEWAPVSWNSYIVNYLGFKLLFLGVLLALTIQIYRKGWKQIDRTAVILIGLFMALAMTSARHTSLFAVAAGALIPGLFPPGQTPAESADPLRRLGGIAMKLALVLVPLITALYILPKGAGLRLEYPHVAHPVDAVNFLQRRDIRGNLLVPFNYGSYALWELRGKMRVSMDGRYDLVYLPETYRHVDDFFSARGDWRDLLASPRPDAILLPRSARVYFDLLNEPAWTEAWHDPYDAVFLPR
ncbi:MAG TPA: hypothetical protein VGZ93_01110 [Candidatus Methylacidiphilales bacterium]|jgi:hypothetical protein|nr:hypothetical protein [Candidatus Methylacidiphilales bacterium]